MNLIDRLFCLLLGHNWSPAAGRRVWSCPLCTRRTTDLEIANHIYGRHHGPTDAPLAIDPPRRMWRHTH